MENVNPDDSEKLFDGRFDHLPVETCSPSNGASAALTMSELQARVRAGLHSGFCLSGHEGIICTADFKPVCGLIAPLRWMRRKDGSGYGMEVAFGTRDGVVARMVFDNRDLDGRRVIARLADSGFSLLGAPTDFKQLLRAWPDLRVDLRADHAGWVETPLGEIYMRPDGTSFAEVRCAASQAILVNPRPAQKAGTLTGWQEAVAGSALGNELLMFGICSTLSAPLLKLADLQTTMFHFYGQGPIGKSHLLAVAASTDRSPRLRQSWTVDSDRLEEQLAQSCDGMLDFDCLSENPSSQLLGRLTGLGDEAVSGGATWIRRGVRLSTGERPLANLLVRNRKIVPAAMMSRIIDITADIGPHGALQTLHGHDDGDAFLVTMRQAMREHHGHLMPAFIDAINRDRSAIIGNLPQQIATTIAVILDRAELPADVCTGSRREALRRFALVAIAGEMSIALGLLPWPGGSAIAAVSSVTGRWRFGQDTAVAPKDMLLRLRAFIDQNRHSLVWIDDASPTERADPGRGWQDDQFVYLTKDQLETILPLRDAISGLVKQGIVVPGGERNSWTYRMGRQFEHRPRYYRFRKDLRVWKV